MSAGSRSGVNCTRAKSRPSTRARLRAARVLPSPGKSSSSTWPLARTAESTSVSGRRLPTTAFSTSSSTRRASADASETDMRARGGLGHGDSSSIRRMHSSISAGRRIRGGPSRTPVRVGPSRCATSGSPRRSPCRASRSSVSRASRPRSDASASREVRWFSSSRMLAGQARVLPGRAARDVRRDVPLRGVRAAAVVDQPSDRHDGTDQQHHRQEQGRRVLDQGEDGRAPPPRGRRPPPGASIAGAHSSAHPRPGRARRGSPRAPPPRPLAASRRSRARRSAPRGRASRAGSRPPHRPTPRRAAAG